MRPKKYYALFRCRDFPSRLLVASHNVNSVWWRGNPARTIRVTDLSATQSHDDTWRVWVEFTRKPTHDILAADYKLTKVVFVEIQVYAESRFQDIIPSRVKLRSRKPSAARR